MIPELITLTIDHRNGRRYTYRGVFIAHADIAMHVYTLDFLDPADLDGCEALHIRSFPWTSIEWWEERPAPDTAPYIIVTDDMRAEADRWARHQEGANDGTA